jgi:Zn finger protein HypA/HybF involved in hydrogenase expression
MHELSLAQQIVDAVVTEAAKHGMKRIDEVTIDYNQFTHFDPEFVTEHLQQFKGDPLLHSTDFKFNPAATDDFIITALKGE